ncbi:MAG: putative metal-binding motif-containing protein [Sandaracinaceae bacterium]|nr:putative metal-binding motif-containing protein [Sandaracinaceae bacterium]
MRGRKNGARLCALAILTVWSGCGGTVCPEGTELVGGACLTADGGAPPPPAMDASPGMDGAMPPEEDAGTEDDAGRDGGTPPPLPDAGPITCTDPVRYYRDFDLDGFGDPSASVESCDPVDDFVTNADDCNDTCDVCNPESTEVCDGADNDCDGTSDEGVTSTFYLDGDGDGHGNSARTIEGCRATAGYVAAGDDCDDTCATCHPGASETCDMRDNDCNGAVDDGALSTFYRDADGDGHGNAAMSTSACTAPTGYVSSSDDCDDTCNVCYPGRSEVCDGRDNDCDASVDDGVLSVFYRDADGDGHGLASMSVMACTAPSGHVTSSDDCDDGCSVCYPGRSETCDGEDNDCDGSVDDGVLSTFYRDADGDTYGTSASTQACTAPSGYASRAGDCDDANAARNPGRTEVCNAVDDDCDGSPDQTFACVQNTAVTCTTTCGSTGSGLCTASCGEPAMCNPPAESCNGADDDCDGLIDDGVTTAGAPITASAAGDMHRPKVVRDGSYLYSFWVWGSNVYAWRHNLDGTIAGLSQIPMVAGSENFDVAARNGRIVYAYQPEGGTGVVVRYLDPSSLSTTATQSIASITPDQIEIELDTLGLFHLYTREAGNIRYRLGSSTGVSNASTVSASDGSFDLFSLDGGLRYLTFVTGGQLKLKIGSDSAIDLYPEGSATIREPAVAVSSSGEILVAFALQTTSTASRRIAAIYMASRTANPLLGYRALSGAGVTAALPDGALVPMIDVDHADGYFTVVAIETAAAPPTTVGTARAYRVSPSSHFAIDPLIGSSVQEGVPVVRQSGRPDLLFFNPGGSGSDNNRIAIRPLGCF